MKIVDTETKMDVIKERLKIAAQTSFSSILVLDRIDIKWRENRSTSQFENPLHIIGL